MEKLEKGHLEKRLAVRRHNSRRGSPDNEEQRRVTQYGQCISKTDRYAIRKSRWKKKVISKKGIRSQRGVKIRPFSDSKEGLRGGLACHRKKGGGGQSAPGTSPRQCKSHKANVKDSARCPRLKKEYRPQTKEGRKMKKKANTGRSCKEGGTFKEEKKALSKTNPKK